MKTPGERRRLVCGYSRTYIDWLAAGSTRLCGSRRTTRGTAVFRLVSQEKKLVEGCPITVITEGMDWLIGIHPIQAISLVVHPSGGNIAYIFQVHNIEGHKDDWNVAELRRIRDSVRVVQR